MELLLNIFLLLLSFFILALLTDKYFLNSLEHISEKFKLSPDIAGASLMAIGSSAPELFIAVFAVFLPNEHVAIGLGTILGSALFNLLFIIGAVGIVRKTTLLWQPFVRDISFYLLASVLLIVFILDGEIVLSEVLLLIIIYIVYLFVLKKWGKLFPYTNKTDTINENIPQNPLKEKNNFSGLKKIYDGSDLLISKLFLKENHYFINFSISIILIAFFSWVLVENAINMAGILHIPEGILGLTVLAVGTSIPDLLSSLFVAKKGKSDMAVSNSIGSNVFDILIGLGLPWLLFLFLHNEKIEFDTTTLFSSSLFLFLSILILLLTIVINKFKIGMISGIFFIFIYVLFLILELFII